MYQNVVIGTPIVEPWTIFADSVADWEKNELPNTLFTETRNLAAVMKEAGLVLSVGEVRRNRPSLYVTLTKPNFFRVKWGKNFLHVLVGPDCPESEWADADAFSGDPWPFLKTYFSEKVVVPAILHPRDNIDISRSVIAMLRQIGMPIHEDKSGVYYTSHASMADVTRVFHELSLIYARKDFKSLSENERVELGEYINTQGRRLGLASWWKAYPQIIHECLYDLEVRSVEKK